ncbi:hypothetical protein IWW50_000707 [Coemansia erecta]|nr:hypothetical protein GGF43_004107 [Coemansia sp. RSA 2618]KAJ2829686.1 hypothetical protein IWW50_000707 [Coemansia erecta]
MLALAQPVLGSLAGSGTITYHDYQSLPLEALKYNPPACGMPYAELDMTRITAVQLIDTTSECGQCIKVCNANDPSKFVYVLAVDKGGRGLDLSKPSFGKLFNIDDGVGPAQWSPVDNSNCVGIWSNGGAGAYDGSQVQAPAVDDTPNVPASTTAAAETTPVVNVPVVPEVPAVSSAVQPSQPSPSPQPVPPASSHAVQRSSSAQPALSLPPVSKQPETSDSPAIAVSSSSSGLFDFGDDNQLTVDNNASESVAAESGYLQSGIAHDALSASNSDSDSQELGSESNDESLDDVDSSGAMSVSLAVAAVLVAVMFV